MLNVFKNTVLKTDLHDTCKKGFESLFKKYLYELEFKNSFV